MESRCKWMVWDGISRCRLESRHLHLGEYSSNYICHKLALFSHALFNLFRRNTRSDSRSRFSSYPPSPHPRPLSPSAFPSILGRMLDVSGVRKELAECNRDKAISGRGGEPPLRPRIHPLRGRHLPHWRPFAEYDSLSLILSTWVKKWRVVRGSYDGGTDLTMVYFCCCL